MKHKTAVLFSTALILCTGLLTAVFSSQNIAELKVLASDTSVYSLTLSTYTGGDKQTYTSKDGNSLEFIFHECYTSIDGLLLATSGSSLGNNTEIHGIKSVTVNTSSEDPIFVDVTCYKNGSLVFSDESETNTTFTVPDAFIHNDGFSVTFNPGTPSDTLVTSIVIEYTCK